MNVSMNKIGLTVGRIIWHDFFRRDADPFALEPSIPGICRMQTAAGFDLEFGLDDVACAAT